MNLREKSEVKIQPTELILGTQRQYPPQQGVKLEVDTNQFPRVRWFPLPTIQALEKKKERKKRQPRKSEVGSLQPYFQATKDVLMEVLDSQEMDKFLENYESQSNKRFYFLIMLSFAKWRSKKRVGQFQKMLIKQWKRREGNDEFNNKQQEEELQRAQKACSLCLKGKIQQAVQQLYKGFKKSKSSRVYKFIKTFNQKIRDNEMIQPNFKKYFKLDSSYQEQGVLPSDDSEFQPKESSYSQLNEQMDQEKKDQLQKDNKQDYVFLIFPIGDNQNIYIYPYDAQLKLKKRITDCILL